MSTINSVGVTPPITKLQAPASAKPADAAAESQTLFRGRDSVEISGVQGTSSS